MERLKLFLFLLLSFVFVAPQVFAGFCPNGSEWDQKTAGCYCVDGYKLNENKNGCEPISNLEKELNELNETLKGLKAAQLKDSMEESKMEILEWELKCNGQNKIFKYDSIEFVDNVISYLKNPHCIEIPEHSYVYDNDWVCDPGYGKSLFKSSPYEYLDGEVYQNNKYWDGLSIYYYCEKYPNNSIGTKTINYKSGISIDDHKNSLIKELDRISNFRDLTVSDKKREAESSVFRWNEAPWDCKDGYEHREVWEQGRVSYELNKVKRCFPISEANTWNSQIPTTQGFIMNKQINSSNNSVRQLYNGTLCKEGYARSLNKKYCVKIPDNAHFVESATDVWLCDDGFKESGNSCIKEQSSEIDKVPTRDTSTTNSSARYSRKSSGYTNYKSKMLEYMRMMYQ